MYFFAQDTPRGSLERMMRAVPRPPLRRGSGPGPQQAETTDKLSCPHCTSYQAGRGCRVSVCPHLAERLASGSLRYRELALSAFPLGKYSRLGRRLSRLAAKVGGFRFRSEPHQARWLNWTDARASPRWLAAVYLLTAREALWERVKGALPPGEVRWDRVNLGSLDPQSYALYKAAKGLWHGRLDITPLELEDPDLIHDDTLLLIANAVLLTRYGRPFLEQFAFRQNEVSL